MLTAGSKSQKRMKESLIVFIGRKITHFAQTIETEPMRMLSFEIKGF